GLVADVNYTNIEKLADGADLIMDGLDNLETRLLINDVSLKHRIPWVYGGAVSSTGMTMTIIPGETPCFRCFWTSPPSQGIALTCDTAGIINPAPMVIGSLQSAEAMKILIGTGEINRNLIIIDVWRGGFKHMKLNRRVDCPSCNGEYEYLGAKYGTRVTSLCGQNSVQILNPEAEGVSFERLATQLAPVGEVNHNEFMFRFKIDNREMVIFPDGRAIVKNTDDEALARGLYAKYIGM
ncbi:ThiF family adenylyltransferase, partial [Chloroflexota bacterium]